jgi:hypothetical protein
MNECLSLVHLTKKLDCWKASLRVCRRTTSDCHGSWQLPRRTAALAWPLSRAITMKAGIGWEVSQFIWSPNGVFQKSESALRQNVFALARRRFRCGNDQVLRRETTARREHLLPAGEQLLRRRCHSQQHDRLPRRVEEGHPLRGGGYTRSSFGPSRRPKPEMKKCSALMHLTTVLIPFNRKECPEIALPTMCSRSS